MDRTILYVVLPCYNEECNISSLIDAWKDQECALWDKSINLELVVVDDGSSDNTSSIVKSKALIYDRLTLLSHGTNQGLGEALNTGVNYALNKSQEGLLCIMDGDMTQDPKYIHSMIDKLIQEKLHCVIASRYQRNSMVEGLAFYRKCLSFCASALYTLRFRIPNVKDYTCGYRLYSIGGLGQLSARYGGRIVREKGFACMIELLIKINREKLKVGEVPFVLKYQLKGGDSKLKIFKTIARELLLMIRL